MTESKLCHLDGLPTETLLYIFSFVTAKDVSKLRRVCCRLKQIIDDFTQSEALWRHYSKKDFKKIYNSARSKANPDLLWVQIYRSLSLWDRLNTASELKKQFSLACNVDEEIRNFEVLRDGIIAVHKRSSIIYYDIRTLKACKRSPITGEYMRYSETEDTIIILSYHLHLHIMRKVIQGQHSKIKVTIDNVKNYIMVNNVIFYITLNDTIYQCQLEDPDLSQNLVQHSPTSIMCLGYTENLHILTYERDIYSVIGNELTFTCTVDPECNLLHHLNEYNFLENLDWRIYFQWMAVIKNGVPEGPLRDIISVRCYGDVYFVGSNWGILQIYYAPYISGVFDIFNSRPVKLYNFMERYDCPVLSMCPILQTDVIEVDDGHIVLIAMPKKIAVLSFAHNFKKTVSIDISDIE